ncbi:MAG: tetratricopeptide repeat protein [Polyangia bacterium]
MRVIAAIALVCMAPSAHADPVSPDEEVARRGYAAGVEAYDRGDFTTALQQFTAAKAARPHPAFDFNLGRCLDRLGRWKEAADAYERFLAARPDAPNAVELRARVTELRARHVDTNVPVADPVTVQPKHEVLTQPPQHHYRLAAELVLGGAVLAGVAGGVVYGTAYHDFSKKRDTCMGTCMPSETTSIRNEVHSRTIAAGVLWGVAGAALVADVALWILDSRRASAVQARFDGGAVHF